MVAFCSVANLKKYLATQDIGELLLELTDRLESDFKRWESFELQPRVASHSPYGVIELMPTSDGDRYAFKYVNGHPINTKLGRQTVTAFGVVSEVDSGYPIFLSEMTILTALRTAAASTLATKHLASPESLELPAAMIGAGAQAEFQAVAAKAAFGTNRFQVHDTDPEASEKLKTNLAPLGVEIDIFTSAEAAVAGAGVVTTCTADKRNAIVLHNECVEPGMHINGVGGDCPGKTELEGELVDRCNTFVEYTPQTRIEGEIQQMNSDYPVTELWEVITGAKPGRQAADEITLFDSVGFAIEDFTVLGFMLERLQGTEYLEDIDLVAEPHDPKNLWGFVHGGIA
jgi:ornithine cyclodeaminase